MRIRVFPRSAVPNGRGAIEDWIDLHGFAPKDVVSAAEAYLEEAARLGLDEVRLVHGRGKGVQRRRVRAMLARHPLVLRFADAPATRGGFGATLAWLRVIDAEGRLRWLWEPPRDEAAAAAQRRVLESALERADTVRLVTRTPGRLALGLDRRFPFVHLGRGPEGALILATVEQAAALGGDGVVLIPM